MEVKISIPDNQFEDILKNEINSLTKEQLSEIVQNGIKEYMFSDEGKKLIIDKFLTKSTSYYSSNMEIQPWIENMLKESLMTTSLSNDIKEVGDSMVSYLKENHKKILENVFLNIIYQNVNNSLFNNNDFQQNMKCVINQVLYENRNE